MHLHFLTPASVKMGDVVEEVKSTELYVPRKCTATNRVIGAKVPYTHRNIVHIMRITARHARI